MGRAITGYDTALESPATVNGLTGESCQRTSQAPFHKQPYFSRNRSKNCLAGTLRLYERPILLSQRAGEMRLLMPRDVNDMCFFMDIKLRGHASILLAALYAFTFVMLFNYGRT